MRTVSAQPVGLRKCTIRSVITLFRKRRFSGGLGGVGKSTLAIQYAWENHERYAGAWWLGAETKASIVDGLVALGTIFIPGLAEVKDLPQAANMALKLIAKGGFEKPWLPRKKRSPPDNGRTINPAAHPNADSCAMLPYGLAHGSRTHAPGFRRRSQNRARSDLTWHVFDRKRDHRNLRWRAASPYPEEMSAGS